MINRKCFFRLQAAALFVLTAVWPGELLRAEQLVQGTSQLLENTYIEAANSPQELSENQQVTSPAPIQVAYILGPGDGLIIELLDI